MFKNANVNFINENSVEIVFTNNGVKTIKTISLNDFVGALNASITQKEIKKDACISPIYPVFDHIHTVQHINNGDGRETLILLRNNKPIDMLYFDTKFKQIGVPKLLFAINIFKGIIQSVNVAAVKSSYINQNTLIYYYPMAHVSSPTSSACLGGNRLADKDFKLKELNMAYKVPDMFLSMPNGHDYYNKINLSNLQMRPLLEALENKPFPDGLLKPAKIKYNE